MEKAKLFRCQILDKQNGVLTNEYIWAETSFEIMHAYAGSDYWDEGLVKIEQCTPGETLAWVDGYAEGADNAAVAYRLKENEGVESIPINLDDLDSTLFSEEDFMKGNDK